MSDSEEQELIDFSGFLDLFNSTFQAAHINIQSAFREYAVSQGIEETETSCA